MKKNRKIKIKNQHFHPAKMAFLGRRLGFSLIEVLFTLMIISVGVVAISALMAGNIRTSTNAKNQIIASGLAQEGIELVINLKDSSENFSTDVSDGNDYKVDCVTSYADFKSSNSVNTLKERLSLLNDVYSHSTASGTIATKFYRKIKIATVGGNRQVESLVVWDGVGVPLTCNIANKCVSVQAVFPIE